jgi:hypothetical protein
MLASVDRDGRRLVEAAAVLAEPTDLVMLGAVADTDDPATALAAARSAADTRRAPDPGPPVVQAQTGDRGRKGS